LKQRYRTLRYGMFVAGLFVAGVSLLVCIGNDLALEGRSGSIAMLSILGMIGGSIIAGVAIITGALMSRRVVGIAESITPEKKP
jgi:hypothetical protein